MKTTSSPPPTVELAERRLLKGDPEEGGMLMRASIEGRQAATKTNSFLPVTTSEICSQVTQEAALRCVHMVWALAADGNGILRPRAQWLVE